jgi:hypothetical protein
MHIILFVVLVSLSSLGGCFIGQKLFGKFYGKCSLESNRKLKENL